MPLGVHRVAGGEISRRRHSVTRRTSCQQCRLGSESISAKVGSWPIPTTGSPSLSRATPGTIRRWRRPGCERKSDSGDQRAISATAGAAPPVFSQECASRPSLGPRHQCLDDRRRQAELHRMGSDPTAAQQHDDHRRREKPPLGSWSTVFASDGAARSGASTSPALCRCARKMRRRSSEVSRPYVGLDPTRLLDQRRGFTRTCARRLRAQQVLLCSVQTGRSLP
jgi:hypothetical protein